MFNKQSKLALMVPFVVAALSVSSSAALMSSISATEQADAENFLHDKGYSNVNLSREFPSLACGADLGKPAREFTVIKDGQKQTVVVCTGEHGPFTPANRYS